MNKTYKANKNHPELKEGTVVRFDTYIGEWFTECNLVLGYISPEYKPEWYDEVVQEDFCDSCTLMPGVVCGGCGSVCTNEKINLYVDSISIEQPTVSDEVVEGKHFTEGFCCHSCMKKHWDVEPTVSDDEVDIVLDEISDIVSDGGTQFSSTYRKVDPHKLATYLAKLEKRV